MAIRFLYLAWNQHSVRSKETSIYIIALFVGALGGYLIGLWGSIVLLQPKEEDALLWVLIISYVSAIFGFFGGLFVGRLLTRKSN